MRIFTRLLFIVAILCNACVMTFAQSAPKETPETSTITGRVTTGDDQPLPGVSLVLMPSQFNRERKPAGRAMTGADGFYRMPNVPAGSYRLQLLAPAYTPANALPTGGWNEGKTIIVTAGETIEGQDFTLARGGVITGRVTDADGKPAIAEHLILLDANQDDRSGRDYAISPYAFETDDRGVYRIYGLPAGRYHVSVGEDTGNGAVRIAFTGKNVTRTFHPSATERAQAKIVEVSPGSEATGIDIMLAAPVKTYEAAGRMIDAQTGKPVPGVMYGIGVIGPDNRQLIGQGWGNSKTDADGEFRFKNLLPGRYAATTRAEGEGAANYYSAPAPFEITDGNVENLVVKLQRGATLSGVVVLEGTTTADRTVLANLARLTLHINVRPAEPNSAELRAWNSTRARLQPDGSFRITGLSPGKAQLQLEPYSAPKGFALLRVEHGGEQNGGIEIEAGKEVAGVRAVVAYGTSVVRGQIEVQRDGATAQLPADVQLHISIRRRGVARSPWGDNRAEVDGRGRFILDGLAAGEYELTTNGWIRPLPGTPQATSLPAIKQIVNVPEKGETSVTVVYDLSAKPPEETTP
ncbi:MAG: MSCRAMM family protein [Pyrinomonadaceae bacterium]